MNKNRLSSRYEIKKEIGRGAMGVVYQAWDPKACRDVAIKVLLSEHSGKLAYLERFEREARAMGQLAHDNIVRLFDVGCDGDDHYLVMEYFPSKNLAEIMFEGGQLPEPEVLKIALQVAEGLSYAHGKGIIHRDIKPGNIMMDQSGDVKIADFGIAKISDSKLIVASALTALGAVLGTEKYMSPEQAEAASIDGQSDLYSLGVVISELVTGKRNIFAEPDTLKIGGDPPEKADPQEISIPLKTLLKALLQKDRTLRVSDAAVAIKMIEAILENKHHPVFFGKAVYLVIALVLLAAGSFYVLSENQFFDFNAPLEVERKKEQTAFEVKRLAEEQLEGKKRLVEAKEKRLAEAQKQLVSAREKQIAAEKERLRQEQLEKKKRLVEAKEKRLAEEQKQLVLAREKQIAMEKRRITRQRLEENKRLTALNAMRLAEKRKEAESANAAQNRAVIAAEDLRQLEGRLNVFEKAYENKALSQLKSISMLSPETAQLLERIFKTYASVEVSLSSPKVKENVAEFVVSIKGLMRKNGITNHASSRWKNRIVTIRKKERKWGKFEW